MPDWQTGVRRFLLQKKYRLSQPISGGAGKGPDPGETPLDPSLKRSESTLREILAGCGDVVFRDLHGRGLLLYCQGLIDSAQVHEHVVTPLLHLQPEELTFAMIERHRVSIGHLARAASYEDVVGAVFEGHTAVLVDGEPEALLFDAALTKLRAVSEPSSEPTVRGPRDGFTEDRLLNISLVRRRLRHPALKTQTIHLGRLSQTGVTLLWLEGVVNQGILEELRKRITDIDIDVVLESAYIEEFIEEHPWSPLPTINHTERPDRVTAMLNEGRIAIMVDNTPFVMIVPTLFSDFFQTSEDYYSNYLQSTLLRWIRVVGLVVSMVLPSLYVALTAFHQEVLPTPLLLSTAAAREGIPMPAVLEALVMQLVFEIVREAGVRMPRTAGSAVTIVGALVIGEAAVRAGLISAPMVIVVSLTALSSFVLPNYFFMLAIRVLSLGFILLAGLFGFLGILAGEIALLIHLNGMRSFGVAYLEPLVPAQQSAWKDVIMRLPFFATNKRAKIAADGQRIPKGQRPRPPGVDPNWDGGKR